MYLLKVNDSNSHGHLCPNNILIDPNTLKLKICDFGFTFLRKYCSLLNGYKNKDVYCAPELLRDNKSVVSNPSETSDVYSFGMIAWRILSGDQPFQGYSLQKIKQVIVEERSRPKLEADLNQDLQRLVRACWQHDPNSRPNFSDINDMLTQISME